MTVAAAMAQPKIGIKDSKKNFGFVKKGEQVKLEYEITNEGNAPLIITEYKVECECTSVEIPTKPILPGESSIIWVRFNTSTVYDRQDRRVEIISNAGKEPMIIRFKGVVLKK